MKSQEPHPGPASAPASGPPFDPTGQGTGADAVAAVTGATPAPAAASNQRGNSRLAAETWRTIRRQAIAGASVQILARAYGIGAATIRNRARAEDWPTPQRITAGACRAKRDLPPIMATHPEQLAQTTHGTATAIPISYGNSPGGRHPAATDVSEPPARRSSESFPIADPVSAAVAEAVDGLIMQALGTIAPPASWAQLQAAYALSRQAKGLDKPQPKAGNRVLISVGSGTRPRIREKSQVVDVD